MCGGESERTVNVRGDLNSVKLTVGTISVRAYKSFVVMIVHKWIFDTD